MKNQYLIMGEETIIFIKYKEEIWECVIDTEDLFLVSSIPGTWFLLNEKYAETSTYTEGVRNSIQMHRLIMSTPKGMFTDHKDGNGLNNRKGNLCIVTNAQNLQNRGAQVNNKSGIPGVYWKKDKNKWCGRIKLKGKTHFVGYFGDLEEARVRMEKARIQLHTYYAEVKHVTDN